MRALESLTDGVISAADYAAIARKVAEDTAILRDRLDILEAGELDLDTAEGICGQSFGTP